MTLIYSSEVSTIQQNYQLQKPIRRLKIKYYLHNGSRVFEFSYKLYLAQNVQLCLGTSHPISPELYVSAQAGNVSTAWTTESDTAYI